MIPHEQLIQNLAIRVVFSSALCVISMGHLSTCQYATQAVFMF